MTFKLTLRFAGWLLASHFVFFTAGAWVGLWRANQPGQTQTQTQVHSQNNQ